jgi:hypothetical protein
VTAALGVTHCPGPLSGERGRLVGGLPIVSYEMGSLGHHVCSVPTRWSGEGVLPLYDWHLTASSCRHLQAPALTYLVEVAEMLPAQVVHLKAGR